METLVEAAAKEEEDEEEEESSSNTNSAFSMQKATTDRHSFLESLKQTRLPSSRLKTSATAMVEESKKFCERKNGRGVDVNRNFPVNFGVKEDYDPNRSFQPIRDVRTRSKVLEKLFKDGNRTLEACLGMEAIFTPYDHKNEDPKGEDPEFARKIGEEINQMHCGKRCVTGSGGKGVGYLAHGTVTDYAFDVVKVPAAFTWEIYGDTQAHFDDCFAMFNPVTKEKHDDVVESWAGAGLSFAHLMRSHPAVGERKEEDGSGSSRGQIMGEKSRSRNNICIIGFSFGFSTSC